MPPSPSPLAYDDIRDIADRALQSARGVRISFATEGQANNFLGRFNYFRREIDRKGSREIFPPEDPRYNRSIYDKLVPRKIGLTVESTKRSADDFNGEEI